MYALTLARPRAARKQKDTFAFFKSRSSAFPWELRSTGELISHLPHRKPGFPMRFPLKLHWSAFNKTEISSIPERFPRLLR
jgi:hypothetical protein